MKEQILQIAFALEQGRIDELTAQKEFLCLFGVIARLKAIKPFDINNYIVGAYEIDSEREEVDDGTYIDADEINKLLNDIEKGNAL